jgi:hypothetical protein
MEVERPMKFRTIFATAAVAATALAGGGAGTAGAQQHLAQPPGPTLDVTLSGPSGVVWTGQCPAFIYEDATDQLPANCKPHGTGQIAWLKGLGVTSIAESDQGRPAESTTIAPDGASVTTVINPGPWVPPISTAVPGFVWPAFTAQTVETCPIVDGAVSLTLPCETNQAFKDYKAEVDAANVVFIAELRAQRRAELGSSQAGAAKARAKRHSARR